MDVVCKLFLRFFKFLVNFFDILFLFWRCLLYVFNKVLIVVCILLLSSVFLVIVGLYSVWDSIKGLKILIMNR